MFTIKNIFLPKVSKTSMLYTSVSQMVGRDPVPGHGKQNARSHKSFNKIKFNIEFHNNRFK